MKYRVVFYPRVKDEPYWLEKYTREGRLGEGWEYLQSFKDLVEVDRFIEQMKRVDTVIREFELP